MAKCEETGREPQSPHLDSDLGLLPMLATHITVGKLS
jgi:hypothetical protein